MKDVFFAPIPISEIEAIVERSLERVLAKQSPLDTTTDDKLLTVADAAAFLSLSIPTIYSLVSKREIPFLKPKGTKRIYFLKEDLKNYIKDGRQRTKSEMLLDVQNNSKTHKKRSKT